MNTTVNVPRFNNAGGQTTVLLAQNTSEVALNAHIFFWDADGGILAINAYGIASKAVVVDNLANNPVLDLAGKSGSITITHDGAYGALVVKAVALEPATGSTFEIPGVSVPG